MQTKDYLGDSVYAEYDGCGIMLTTENGGPPSNAIFLEPAVLEALLRFNERIHQPTERTEQSEHSSEHETQQ